ncbi:SRPBCC family protein [Robiginitomaculum antarcticum]|uniref:SRPBCC family protein n=1 Tax=Robiginitomaculum antarcticum TaxID=437507 RepID=UPI000381859E|nr:SRPBCC family protein [Robiginitomaculum antarcticum]
MPYDDKPQGDAPDFVYTIYIAAKIETVWNGLIDKEVTQKYWGHLNKSDWKTGSKWEHIPSSDSTIVDVHGQVLDSDPPRKLVVTWNSLPGSKSLEPAPSLVTYDLVALGPDTKLTVTHSQLTKDSVMHKGVTQGWPAVLSNLKSILETGKTLSDGLWGDTKQKNPDH